MVHIPFLNIEVPEPRLHSLVPDLVTLILRMCTRGVDAAMHFTHPLPQPIQDLYVQEVIESFPTEVQRVLLRGIEGKHRDEDHVSEELEDATLDYYRRMIRTAAVGASEEDQEDVTAYKLGLDRPSAQDIVWDLYVREHEDGLLRDADEVLAVQGTPEEQASIQAALAEAAAMAEQELELPRTHEERRRMLRGRVRTDGQQTAGAALRAGLSLALSIGAVRGLGLLMRQLRKLRKPKKGKKGPKASSSMPRRTASAAAAGAAQQATASPQQQQQQQQQQPAAAAKPRPRTSTRKR